MGDRYDRRRRLLLRNDAGPLPSLAPFYLFLEDPNPRIRIGHNNGPPLESVTWTTFCWKKAHAAAWKSPPREVVLMRLKRAQELGMTYKEYTAVILDRGVYL